MSDSTKKGRPLVGAQKKERLSLTVDASVKEMLDALRADRQLSASQIVEEYIMQEYRRLERKKKKMQM